MKQKNYKILLEDIFDELSQEDISKDSKKIITNEFEDDGKYGAHKIWFHGYHFMSFFQCPKSIEERKLYLLDVLDSRTKFISNLDFFYIENNTGDVINVRDADALHEAAAKGRNLICEVYMTFDYDENRQADIAYMMNVLIEACNVFSVFIKNFTTFNLKSYHYSFNPDHENEEYYRDGDYITKEMLNELRKFNLVILSSDGRHKNLVKSLRSLGAEIKSANELINYMNKLSGNNVADYSTLIKCGAKPSLARIFKIYRVVGGDEHDCTEIEIPQNTSVSLGNLYLGTFSAETNHEPVLVISGILNINSFEEFSNLKFISKKHKNNCIRFNTPVSEKLIRYMLSNFWFNQIDFSGAHPAKDETITIDTSISKNPKIRIDSSKGFEVK